MKTIEDLVQIVSHGGGVIVDSTLSTDDLVKLASYGAGKSHIVIRGANRKTLTISSRLCSLAKGR